MRQKFEINNTEINNSRRILHLSKNELKIDITQIKLNSFVLISFVELCRLISIRRNFNRRNFNLFSSENYVRSRFHLKAISS